MLSPSRKPAAAVSAKPTHAPIPPDAAAARLMRLPAVVAVCDAGKSTILTWVRQGRFPAPVKFGNYTAWKSADVTAWCSDPAAWVETNTSEVEAAHG